MFTRITDSFLGVLHLAFFFLKKKLVKINKTEHPWFEAKKARKGMKSKESKFNKRDDNE